MSGLGRFLYDFVVGDDPVVALLVVVAIAGAWLLRRAGADAWWAVPAVVVAALALSLWRFARSGAGR